jgi:glutamate synthase (NADPH/NADH) small chain
MGKTSGFLEYNRSLPVLRDPVRRVGDWDEFHQPLPAGELTAQAARCMNCGVPFCHVGQATESGAAVGCPIHNLIPDWNDLVYRGRWFEAYKQLSRTNNFPEFTGRVCPAPCESSCILGINEEPVMIKEIEQAIIDRAFEEGWVGPNPPADRTGKRVAVIGSGPAGLACADELNKYGHHVTVFERSDRIGGLLMYGIPNMKLDKRLVDRRVGLLADEGIEFRTGVNAGVDISADDLKRDFDAVVLCGGASKPRDLSIDGREFRGIHFAMDFLTLSTKNLLSPDVSRRICADVKDKEVIVIGGGDTGTDCIATSLRLGCRSVTQFEIMDRPPDRTLDHDNWLSRVRTFTRDYGHAEASAVYGSDPRQFNVLTKGFVGDSEGNLTGLETITVEWKNENGYQTMREVTGSGNFWKADAVFLAMGFTGVERSNLLVDLDVKITDRGTIAVDNAKQTSQPFVFAAGDCERGQSLVVWAIADGRTAALNVDKYLRRT